MTTSDREIQKWLRQIVLKPEPYQAAAGVVDMPRIGDGAGEIWWDKNGDGKPDDEDPNKDPDKDKDRDKDKNPDGTHDPTKTPEVGDDANGIGPLFDCENPGKCINVRLDGMAKPPEGWVDVCEPPPSENEDSTSDDEKVYYWKADAYWYSNNTRIDEEKIFFSAGAAMGWVQGMIPSGKDTDGNGIIHWWINDEDIKRAVGSYFYDTQNGYEIKDSDPRYYTANIQRLECSEGTADENCIKAFELKKQAEEAKKLEWDKNACSEVVAKDGGFQAACPDLPDPNMPEIFKHNPTAFTLCDENGNPVTIEPYGLGWKITTDTYEATVNSDFKFQNVVQKI